MQRLIVQNRLATTTLQHEGGGLHTAKSSVILYKTKTQKKAKQSGGESGGRVLLSLFVILLALVCSVAYLYSSYSSLCVVVVVVVILDTRRQPGTEAIPEQQRPRRERAAPACNSARQEATGRTRILHRSVSFRVGRLISRFDGDQSSVVVS